MYTYTLQVLQYKNRDHKGLFFLKRTLRNLYKLPGPVGTSFKR